MSVPQLFGMTPLTNGSRRLIWFDAALMAVQLVDVSARIGHSRLIVISVTFASSVHQGACCRMSGPCPLARRRVECCPSRGLGVGLRYLSMAKSYRPVDRDQAFLLPPDMRSWLPAEHLVWFVISVVDQLDVSAFESRSRRGGVGRAGFDPRMLLTVLIYSYAMGERSSRQIERLCHTDVAFRVACAQDVPDHTTIARFRQHHEDALKDLFTHVLELCAKSGLGKLGTVAIDGTKIAANASDGAMRSEKWLREQVEAILGQAEETDAAEDALFGAARGDELPADLADPATRAERIRKALADLEAEKTAEQTQRAERAEADRQAARDYEQRVSDQDGPVRSGRPPRAVDPVTLAQARLARAVAQAQERIDRYQQRVAEAAAQGRRPMGGPAPVSVQDYSKVKRAQAALEQAQECADQQPAASPDARDKIRYRNITDPDARSMPTQKGWLTGYNNQLSVSADQLILAVLVGQSPTDTESFIPMLDKTQQAADLMARCGSPHADIGIALADAGYRSVQNVTAPGPDRLIATGKRRDDNRRAREEPTNNPAPEGACPLKAMDHRLRTEEGQRTYRDRGHLVEGVNGQLKDVIGLRRFARPDYQPSPELHFAAAVHNILKLFRSQLATA